jgi:acetolactate synthase-1/2/3 large subunit
MTVSSYELIRTLSAIATRDDVIVTDVGLAYQHLHQAWHIKEGQRLLSNNGLAPMGWGLPAAIGAAVGSGRRVIAMIGDGGMMMNIQELATVAHHQLPIKIFLWNNGGYVTMRKSQANAFDGYMGSDEGSGISFPSFDQIALAHGLCYAPLSHPNLIEICMRFMFENDSPAFCEVMLDPNEDTIPKSINRRVDGKIVQTPIEDAWPYLDREELAENLKV